MDACLLRPGGARRSSHNAEVVSHKTTLLDRLTLQFIANCQRDSSPCWQLYYGLWFPMGRELGTHG